MRAFVLLIIKNTFTLQHAKEQYMEAVWNTPAFISVNYVFTWIFAVVFTSNTVISAIWGFYSIAAHVVSPALLFVAIAFTKVLPKYYVPYCMRKYGKKAGPKDLSKMPLRLIFEGMIARFTQGQRVFMEGRMKIEGDMNQLFRMQGVFQGIKKIMSE